MEYKWITGDSAMQAALNEAAANGTLTHDMLLDAFYTMDRVGYECIPHNVGVSWALRNPEAFRRAIGNVESFLSKNSNNGDLIQTIVNSPELLKLIPKEQRVSCVSNAFLKTRRIDRRSIYAAVRAGVPRTATARLALEFLNNLPQDDQSYNMANAFDDFVGFGAGDVIPRHEWKRKRARKRWFLTPPNVRSRQPEYFEPETSPEDPAYWHFPACTPWGVFKTDEELFEAFRICAQKAPRRILEHWQTIAKRLRREDVVALCNEAAEHLLEFRLPTKHEMFDLVQGDARINLLRRFAGNNPLSNRELYLHLFFSTVCAEGWERGAQIFRGFKFSLGGNAAADGQLMGLRMARGKDVDPRLARFLEEELRQQLEELGLAIGKVVEGKYRDKRTGRDEKQYQVVHKGLTYVQDRSAHRYFPAVGDEVVFGLRGSKRLTPTVVATYFTPLSRQ